MSLLPDPDRIDERKLWTLLATLVVIFLFYPVAHGLGILRFYRLALLLAVGQATYSVSGNRTVRKIAVALCIPTVLGQVLTVTQPAESWVFYLAMALLFAFFAFAGLIILKSVFRPGEITGDRIAGAICLYLIAGLLWAIVYGAILLADPASFHLPEAAREMARQGGEMSLLYFSFVTLTTLGYGDISPISPLAQTVAWSQAVTGQLYIAILLARLVSLHVAKQANAANEHPPEES